MMDIFLLRPIEIVNLFVAALILFCYYKISKYTNISALLCTLCFVPIFYFSINMLTEAITIDEPQYEACITEVRNIVDQPAATKVLYEYKLSQATIGTIFLLIPDSIKSQLNSEKIWKIYRISHWMLLYLTSLGITYIWKRYIFFQKDAKKNILFENLVLLILLGLPISCLLMKVTNYDGGSTYPAILGISLLWVAYNKRDKHWGLLATIVTGLGVLDKWTAYPYWGIAVVLFVYMSIKEEKSFIRKLIESFKAAILSCSAAIGISVVYFLLAYIQQGRFVQKIDLGIILFSFTHGMRSFIDNDMSVYSSNQDFWLVGVFILLAVFIALILDYASEYFSKRTSPYILYLRIAVVLLAVGGISAVVITFWVPQCSGVDFSADGMYCWGSNYICFGAKTLLGHVLRSIGYVFASVFSGLPTIFLILCFVCLLLARKIEEQCDFCALILMAVILLLIVYGVASIGYAPRYYSFSTYLICLCLLYILYCSCDCLTVGRRILLYGGVITYLVEMALFVPNFACFSPIWDIHGEEYNKSLRIGWTYAGESLPWGEELAIAGRFIKEYIDENDSSEYKKYKIYSNYVCDWLTNPGFDICLFSTAHFYQENFEFENSFFVMNKRRLYRQGSMPEYISQIDPFMEISFKGERAVWIYKGEQLRSLFAEE